jgi:hypothetical protein
MNSMIACLTAEKCIVEVYAIDLSMIAVCDYA